MLIHLFIFCIFENWYKFFLVITIIFNLLEYLQVDGTDMKFLTANGSNTGLELKGRPLYFGGIPESYDLEPFLKW